MLLSHSQVTRAGCSQAMLCQLARSSRKSSASTQMHRPEYGVQSSWLRCGCRRFCAHPGELGAARAFCAAVQERLLRSVCNLGARLPAYIRIAASVHTDIDMFTFSQPALEEGDGEPVLQVF